ncbi:BTB/POZ domain-containing protein 16-like [Watersipora subatra]|uniref:BTB/POZ domain-containing protein 16-like n=1 Tax=Watersipora subatra TaxID=2589382 RepID=UPI00355BECA1
MAYSEIASYNPPTAFLPTPVVQVPRPVVDHAKYLVDAPIIALKPVRADGVQEQTIKYSKRHRTRLQVGNTNRWRLPQSLLSDLLGISQASRAVKQHEAKPFNTSYVKVCTAEGRHNFMNENANEDIPQSFNNTSTDRMPSQPLRSSFHGSRANKSALETRTAQSAPVCSRLPKSASSSFSKISSYIPDRARPSTTRDIFFYHSKHGRDHHRSAPDVLLHCLGTDFELHSAVVSKSRVLSSLLVEAEAMKPEQTVYYKSAANYTLDTLVDSAELPYANDEGDYEITTDRSERRDISHPAHISKLKRGSVTNIVWQPSDNFINKDAIAIALGNLYHTKYQVDVHSLPSVLLAACELDFAELRHYCTVEMKKCISYSNVSAIYTSAVKSGQQNLVNCCNRWLELNLVPVMVTKIQLRDIPMSLMESVLKSSRLFTYSEYHLYFCLSQWLFLRLNPQIQLLPTPTNVITYFNSLPKQSSFLETSGQSYVQLFDSLRLHGISETAQFENIRRMNMLPQESLVSLLSEHYSALQSGGDMALMRNFNKSAVRQGFVIEEELPYHCEIMALHGFHFQLKTTKTGSTFTFYMQRLKPTDPVLSFRQCERQTFSMRPDRDVSYCISVQTYSEGIQRLHTTGMETQRFSLSGKHVRSKVLSLKDLRPPLYVTFAILFPQS